MITYDLRCDQQHRFEGWFRSRDDFLQQQEKQMIACPQCGSITIEKCPSVPNVNTALSSSVPQNLADMREVFNIMYQHLVETTEDVGQEFAEEVRKIHYEECPHRRIRGMATKGEVQELAEEGIEVIALPWPDHADSELQ